MAKLSVQGFLVQVGSDRPGLVLCSCVLGFLGTGGKMSRHPDKIQGRGVQTGNGLASQSQGVQILQNENGATKEMDN